MKDYEQMELDLTLEIDRSLKDNVQNVAKFALGQIVRYDHPSRVRNRHEGYGIAAEYNVSLHRDIKAVEVDMKSMLALLPNDEGDFINLCGSLYNSAIETAVSAIKLAAQSQRILEDLYDSETRTPMEDFLNGTGEDYLVGTAEEGNSAEEGNNDFEDAEPADVSVLPEAMEAENEEEG
ncbi:MAG: hypothetical protein NC541_11180 [bacterium]|nr:hypothetical protein [bacterium]MCM1542664.1 hypothetical protein [Blautia sp.]